MEYDNDTIKKPAPKIGTFYWILLAAVNPLVNGITLFLYDIRIWPVLLGINLLVFPIYYYYPKVMGPVLIAGKRTPFFITMSLAVLLVSELFLFAVYSLILKFPLSTAESSYFTWHFSSMIRESLWIIVNISLATAIFFINKAIEEKDLLTGVQKDNAFLQLRYLRMQLNPHFLFNTLNSIYSLSLQKSDRTPDVVIKLADIMRYLIYECNEERIPLDKEIAFIRNYIDIEKTRYEADIRFTIEGETEGILIEPFLFISFIENGFKHALDNSFDEPFIYITLKVTESALVLNVVNSTSADLETQAKRMTGKGIANSRSLLELLYPDSYTLDIIQTDKEETRRSGIRMHNARERLESLYPDSYTLDVILNKNAFTVSLIIRSIMRTMLNPGQA